MVIPRNLIPENVPNELSQFSEFNPPEIASISSINGVPTNLIPINTSEIANSLESISGTIPEIGAPEIPQYTLLNSIIPDKLFKTGSIEQIRQRTLQIADDYTIKLPTAPTLPSIPPITVPFPPKRPSFAQIKNYIETKIDRIKLQRQQASTKALKERLKKKENPFTYRKEVINTAQRSRLNTLLSNQVRMGINQIRG